MGRGTFKPCHGCGGTRWRYADRLCDECAKLLSIGRAMEMDKRHKAENEEGALFRIVPDWPHFMVQDDAARKELVAAFQNLTKRALSPSKRTDPYAKDVTSLPTTEHGRTYYTTFYEKALVYKGPKAVGSAIDRLDLAVRAAIRAEHESGIKHGGDLLGQLARGEITVKKLNDETLQGEM